MHEAVAVVANKKIPTFALAGGKWGPLVQGEGDYQSSLCINQHITG
jgi:hypothetical protein